MPSDDQTGSTLPRRQLGRDLREAREAIGYTQEQAGQRLEIGKTTIGRIEKGLNEKVRQRDIEAFGVLYELSAERVAALKALAAQISTTSWWQASRHLLRPEYDTYLGLEAAASQLTMFQPLIIPGLLQVADYARAVERQNIPSDTPEDFESRVSIRMRRAAIVTRQRTPIPAEFILHESVLHTIAGSRAVMAKQLRHVADMSTRPNIIVRILPFTAGFPGDRAPAFPHIIIDFPPDSPTFRNEPPVVYAENTIGAMFFEESDDVQLYRRTHDYIRHVTLDYNQSRDLLRQVARRHEQ